MGDRERKRENKNKSTGRCLNVGACLKVNMRALGRGALHKKGDSIPLSLTSEHTGRACRQLFTRSV